MISNTVTENLIKEYWLKKLSPDDELYLEELLFEGDELFIQAEAIRSNLIDCYVCGMLGDEDRSCFEMGFLSTEYGRREVGLVQDFVRSISENVPIVDTEQNAAGVRTLLKRLQSWLASFSPNKQLFSIRIE